MECQICFETFDSKNFIPKLLTNCGHSFCNICIQRLINNKKYIICPICREQTKLNSYKEVPTNYSIIEIIDKSKEYEKSKSILERYKFFEIDEYKSIQSKIKRYTEPKELELKQIVNDDFIYIENFENNQNVSIFNSYTKRNRRYNFNRKSLFRLFFNEYSYFLFIFRKSSKCKHNYSCIEYLIKKAIFSISIGVISYFPLYKLFNSGFMEIILKMLFSSVNKEKILLYSQILLSSLLILPSFFQCAVAFYIDDLLQLM